MKKTDFICPSFFHTLNNYKKRTKVFCRISSLPPKALHKNYIVHNGLRFISVLVSEEMIGRKLGEFCQTRRRYYFKKKKLKFKPKKS